VSRLFLLVLVLVLVALGLAMVFNTSSAEMLDRQGVLSYLPAIKQGLNLVLGCLVGLGAYRLGAGRPMEGGERLRRHAH